MIRNGRLPILYFLPLTLIGKRILYLGGENILAEGQKIKKYWSNRIKSYYISKGYEYTERNELFIVDAEDLAPGSRNQVKLVCDECGKEFAAQYCCHYNRKIAGKKDLCSVCSVNAAYAKSREERAKLQFDKIRNICDDNNYDLLSQECEFKNTNMDIRFNCPIHGEQSMSMNNFLSGHRCIKCSYEERKEKQKHTPDHIELVINSINGNKLLNKEEYVHAKVRNLIVLCGKCKQHTYVVSFDDYCNNKVYQCRSCSKKESSGEKEVADYLSANNIDFVREKKFPDCKDIRSLPFDFYLPDHNAIIEYDGAQHYYNVFGKKTFDMTTRHDAIKNDYCKTNNIRLIRIPYWKKGNIKEFLDEEFKKTA